MSVSSIGSTRSAAAKANHKRNNRKNKNQAQAAFGARGDGWRCYRCPFHERFGKRAEELVIKEKEVCFRCSAPVAPAGNEGDFTERTVQELVRQAKDARADGWLDRVGHSGKTIEGAVRAELLHALRYAA